MTSPDINAGGRAASRGTAVPPAGEFSWGKGLMPPPERGYVPDAFDRLRVSRLTDTANPEADEAALLGPNVTVSKLSEDGLETYIPGDQRARTTPLVREVGPASREGALDPSLPKGGSSTHEPDGIQDGSGRRWRESQPPNPVT